MPTTAGSGQSLAIRHTLTPPSSPQLASRPAPLPSSLTHQAIPLMSLTPWASLTAAIGAKLIDGFAGSSPLDVSAFHTMILPSPPVEARYPSRHESAKTDRECAAVCMISSYRLSGLFPLHYQRYLNQALTFSAISVYLLDPLRSLGTARKGSKQDTRPSHPLLAVVSLALRPLDLPPSLRALAETTGGATGRAWDAVSEICTSRRPGRQT